MKINILILGSQGFIGSHAYTYFAFKGYNVYGADVVEDRYSQNYYNLSDSNVDLNLIFSAHQFNFCINASGNGSVPISINRPLFDFELNTFNTIKTLEAIRNHAPSCKFLNLSSAAVYGNPSRLPIKEDDHLNPLSPYGWHKLYSEQICREYYYLYNIQTINLRLFSVYGPGLRKQLFWDIFQKCLRTKHVELFGTGSETRDFIFIDDLVAAFDNVMQQGLFNGEAINIASGIETAISDAAKIFCESVDCDINVSFNNIVKPGDPLKWKADNTILKNFGFTHITPIGDGLKRTAEWLLENK